jgi:hypothetical protein
MLQTLVLMESEPALISLISITRDEIWMAWMPREEELRNFNIA